MSAGNTLEGRLMMVDGLDVLMLLVVCPALAFAGYILGRD